MRPVQDNAFSATHASFNIKGTFSRPDLPRGLHEVAHEVAFHCLFFLKQRKACCIPLARLMTWREGWCIEEWSMPLFKENFGRHHPCLQSLFCWCIFLHIHTYLRRAQNAGYSILTHCFIYYNVYFRSPLNTCPLVYVFDILACVMNMSMSTKDMPLSVSWCCRSTDTEI